MATQTPPTPPPTRARPKMTIYGGGPPPKKRKRRWVRVALWSVRELLPRPCRVVAAVAYWLYGDYSRITSNSKDVQTATKALEPCRRPTRR